MNLDVRQYTNEREPIPNPLGFRALVGRVQYLLTGGLYGRIVTRNKRGIVTVRVRRHGKTIEDSRYQKDVTRRKFYHPNGDVVEVVRSYMPGRPYYREETSRNGEVVSAEEYYMQTITLTPMKNGLAHGEERTYLRTDNVFSIYRTQEMAGGYPNGKCCHFYPDGSLMDEGIRETRPARFDIGPRELKHLSDEDEKKVRIVRGEDGQFKFVLDTGHTYYVGWRIGYFKNHQVESRTFYDNQGTVRDYTQWDSNGDIIYADHLDDKNVYTTFLKDGSGFTAVISKQGKQVFVAVDEHGNRIEKPYQLPDNPDFPTLDEVRRRKKEHDAFKKASCQAQQTRKKTFGKMRRIDVALCQKKMGREKE